MGPFTDEAAWRANAALVRDRYPLVAAWIDDMCVEHRSLANRLDHCIELMIRRDAADALTAA